MTHRVINVGGATDRNLPRHFHGWEQVLLDIDPNVQPDLVCDAREMTKLPAANFDAVYSSHFLEHVYEHEVAAVLNGFLHVLKKSGFVQLMVPDMMALFETVVHGKRDITDTWYTVSAGRIRFIDVIYGWGAQIRKGNKHYCHRTGFSAKSLSYAFKNAGFAKVLTARDGCNLHAFAFRVNPSKPQLRHLGI